MMDWTDRHCRYFHRQLSARARLYTEMLTTGGLLQVMVGLADLRRHVAQCRDEFRTLAVDLVGRPGHGRGAVENTGDDLLHGGEGIVHGLRGLAHVAGAGGGTPAGIGQAIVFARRPGRRFDQIGFHLSVGLHPPHQRVDGALAHVDRVRQGRGDLIGIAVVPVQQGQDAKRQHPLLQLYLDCFRHCGPSL